MQSRSLALFRSIILRSRPSACHAFKSLQNLPLWIVNCDDDYSASGHWNILSYSSNKTGAARLLISTHKRARALAHYLWGKCLYYSLAEDSTTPTHGVGFMGGGSYGRWWRARPTATTSWSAAARPRPPSSAASAPGSPASTRCPRCSHGPFDMFAIIYVQIFVGRNKIVVGRS